MMLRKYNEDYGLKHVVSKGEEGLKKAVFDLLKLKSGTSFSGDTAKNESALVILSGQCSIQGTNFSFGNIGSRKDVFSGKPTAVYLPSQTTYRIEVSTDTEIAVCSTESSLKSKPRLIGPNDVTEVNLGVLSWNRMAYFIVDQNVEAEYIFVGETFLQPGRWAFPPHRHDFYNLPEEVDMDEIYHFRFKPANGFGIQLSYTDNRSRDDAYLVRNGDTVILPDGYHPVASSPVDSLYMLWFMAGEKRIFLSRSEDIYQWVVKCENLLKAIK